MTDVSASRSRPLLIVVLVALTAIVSFVAVAASPATSASAAAAQYVPLTPARLLDTRQPGDAHFGVKSAGTSFEVQVTGRGGVAADAVAAVLNVTVTGPREPGFVTVWPCAGSAPNASALNYAAGETRANSALVQLSATGKICVFVMTATEVIIDVNGYFAAGSGIKPVVPARMIDTRAGATTADGRDAGAGPGQQFRVQVTGRGGVLLFATTVALNVTVTAPQAAGFVTVWPCDSTMPTASNVNFAAGQTASNAVVAKLDANGGVCVYSNTVTHLIVDVTGWFSAGAIDAVNPSRLVDTRQPGSQASGRKVAGQQFRVQVTGSAGVPTTASAVVVTLTAVNPAAAGFVTVFPCGAQPNASALNFGAGQTSANLAVATLDASGGVCVFVQQETDIVIDVTGWFTGVTTTPPTTTTPPSTAPYRNANVSAFCRSGSSAFSVFGFASPEDAPHSTVTSPDGVVTSEMGQLGAMLWRVTTPLVPNCATYMSPPSITVVLDGETFVIALPPPRPRCVDRDPDPSAPKRCRGSKCACCGVSGGAHWQLGVLRTQ